MDLNKLCLAVEDISRKVGHYLLQERRNFTDDKVEEKSFNNLVSYVDKTAEDQFIQVLRKLIPEAGFIAEESEELKREEEWNWIIDPLDGTTNFIFNIPFYCTSVALMKKDEIQLGVIYDPNHDEMYSAVLGQGAFLNKQKIKVSGKTELIRSLLATGFPYDDFNRESEFLALLGDLAKRTKGIRRIGSAAMDLAYVAAGRFEAFYEYGLNPYDVAAGAIIVQEAGGSICDFKGGSNYIFGEEIIASNSHVHQELLERIKAFF